MASLAVRNLQVDVGGRSIVRGVTLSVAAGERLAVAGPSGVGKSTFLRALAGLLPSRGEIHAGDVRVDDRPPERRGIVYLHQQPVLFPHLDVIDNVAFPLTIRRVPVAEARRRASVLLEQVALAPLAQRPVSGLSGGERQRVAVARALAAEPSALLLDEPFAALDPSLRASVREGVLAMLAETSAATIIVTHDLDEAAAVGDRLAVMLDGAIAQCDAPASVLARPATVAVARLVGLPNLVAGTIIDGVLTSPLGRWPVADHADGPVVCAARPDAVRVVSDAECGHGDRTGGVDAVVTAVHERVHGRLLECRVAEQALLVQAPPGDAARPGKPVVLAPIPAAIHVIRD